MYDGAPEACLTWSVRWRGRGRPHLDCTLVRQTLASPGVYACKAEAVLTWCVRWRGRGWPHLECTLDRQRLASPGVNAGEAEAGLTWSVRWGGRGWPHLECTLVRQTLVRQRLASPGVYASEADAGEAGGDEQGQVLATTSLRQEQGKINLQKINNKKKVNIKLLIRKIKRC